MIERYDERSIITTRKNIITNEKYRHEGHNIIRKVDREFGRLSTTEEMKKNTWLCKYILR